MSGLSADVIEDASDLAALTPQWWELWRRSPSALPFQSPAWLLPWWRHFAPGRLFVLAARQEGRLVALSPGYIEDGALGRRILPLGISLSDHLDILVDPACAQEALQAIASIALSRSDAWDVWELEELPPGAMALKMQLPEGWSDEAAPQTPCPVLALQQDGVSAPIVFPRAKRQQINLARNRAARRGTVRIEQPERDATGAALKHLSRLNRLRWASRGEPSVLSSPATEFHREAVAGLDEAGLLRFYILSIGDTVVAAHYGIAAHHRHCVYMTGFDPDYAFESPGVTLMAHTIDQAIAAGALEFDFLRGGEAYKYEWGAVDRWNIKRSIRHSAHG